MPRKQQSVFVLCSCARPCMVLTSSVKVSLALLLSVYPARRAAVGHTGPQIWVPSPEPAWCSVEGWACIRHHSWAKGQLHSTIHRSVVSVQIRTLPHAVSYPSIPNPLSWMLRWHSAVVNPQFFWSVVGLPPLIWFPGTDKIALLYHVCEDGRPMSIAFLLS